MYGLKPNKHGLVSALLAYQQHGLAKMGTIVVKAVVEPFRRHQCNNIKTQIDKSMNGLVMLARLLVEFDEHGFSLMPGLRECF